MRSYGKHYQYKSPATLKQRHDRLATEWDVRLDVGILLTPEDIINNIQQQRTGITYVYVSGIEVPDKLEVLKGMGVKHGSSEEHVHIALIYEVPQRRADVLKLLRGPHKVNDEYCTPRNNKFPYAGWIIHHGKPAYKVEGQPNCLYEYGTLPLDPFTTDWAVRIKSMLKRYGSSDMEQRFKQYTELINKDRIREHIERLTMSLNDNPT